MRELLVLVAGSSGAGKRNGFWEVAHSYLAYVDCEIGTLCADEGRLVYPVSDEDNAAGNVLGRFRDEEIYRVAARKKIPQELPEGMSASLQYASWSWRSSKRILRAAHWTRSWLSIASR